MVMVRGEWVSSGGVNWAVEVIEWLILAWLLVVLVVRGC